MRRFGSILVAVGVLVGVITGASILAGVQLPGVDSWLAEVAIAKLAFFSALGLIAAGTVLQRTADRRAERDRVGAGSSADLPHYAVGLPDQPALGRAQGAPYPAPDPETGERVRPETVRQVESERRRKAP
jgi:hypothetical protein